MNSKDFIILNLEQNLLNNLVDGKTSNVDGYIIELIEPRKGSNRERWVFEKSSTLTPVKFMSPSHHSLDRSSQSSHSMAD